MVNASLTWTSACGLFLLLLWIPASISGIGQIFFVLQRRANNTLGVFVNAFFRILNGLGRTFALPLIAGILFFQGCRLDPILQFAALLLTIGLFAEMLPTLISDYQQWRFRSAKGKEIVPVTVEVQPNER